MMITVVVIYAVCWLPIHAITLIGDSRPDIWQFRHIQSVWIACHWLAMSSCCYNPIVYCWMNPKFRNGFRYILRFCPCVVYDSISMTTGPSKMSVRSSSMTTTTMMVTSLPESCDADNSAGQSVRAYDDVWTVERRTKKKPSVSGVSEKERRKARSSANRRRCNVSNGKRSRSGGGEGGLVTLSLIDFRRSNAKRPIEEQVSV